MKRLSFKTQAWLSVVVLACAFLAEHIFKIGVFHSIGWIFFGLLFLINPVWPKSLDWRDHEMLKKGIRIGCILVIIVFGFLIRYEV